MNEEDSSQADALCTSSSIKLFGVYKGSSISST